MIDFAKINMCLGNKPHEPHDVPVTITYYCGGPEQCEPKWVHEDKHTMTAAVFVPCDGSPQ